MTSPVEQSKDRETCRKLISLGYARPIAYVYMVRKYSRFQTLSLTGKVELP